MEEKLCWICEEGGIITPGQYESKELVTRQAQTQFRYPQHIYLCKECYEELPMEDKAKYVKLPGKDYCTQNEGDCNTCSLVSYGKDCQNNAI